MNVLNQRYILFVLHIFDPQLKDAPLQVVAALLQQTKNKKPNVSVQEKHTTEPSYKHKAADYQTPNKKHSSQKREPNN